MSMRLLIHCCSQSLASFLAMVDILLIVVAQLAVSVSIRASLAITCITPIILIVTSKDIGGAREARLPEVPPCPGALRPAQRLRADVRRDLWRLRFRPAPAVSRGSGIGGPSSVANILASDDCLAYIVGQANWLAKPAAVAALAQQAPLRSQCAQDRASRQSLHLGRDVVLGDAVAGRECHKASRAVNSCCHRRVGLSGPRESNLVMNPSLIHIIAQCTRAATLCLNRGIECLCPIHQILRCTPRSIAPRHPSPQ